jgi:hypothetical protein
MRAVTIASAAVLAVAIGSAVMVGADIVAEQTALEPAPPRKLEAGENAADPLGTTAPSRNWQPPAETDARGVAEDMIAPVDPGGLVREEPRAPLSELALARPPKPIKPEAPGEWRQRLLHQPVLDDDGIIHAGGHAISIPNVEMPAISDTCGAGWPCGRLARTALRAFLRGRAIRCAAPKQPGREVIVTDCTVGGDDIGAWLTGQGWAKPTASGPHAALGAEAERARKGIFSPSADAAQ